MENNEPTSIIVDCDNCNARVQAEIVASFADTNSDDLLDYINYLFCRCPSCSSPILLQQEYDYDGVDLFWKFKAKLYPNPSFHINPVIPEQLQKALIESIQCYKSKANTATVIMCRRTIEGFCSLKGIQEVNLDKSIKRLRDEGYINEQLFEWANELRLSGNEAAHNIGSEFSLLDSKDILDFTIAILDFTYSFKDKFDKFKARRAS